MKLPFGTNNAFNKPADNQPSRLTKKEQLARQLLEQFTQEIKKEAPPMFQPILASLGPLLLTSLTDEKIDQICEKALSIIVEIQKAGDEDVTSDEEETAE